MKLSSVKFLLTSLIAFSSQAAYANIYSVTLSYTDQSTPTIGSLSGFIVIDESQFDNQENRTSGNFIFGLPSWVQQASLTFTPTVGSSTTTTSFTAMDWNVAVGTDFTLDGSNGGFLDQVTRFGLYGDDYSGAPNSAPLQQQYSTGEFLLSSGVPVNQVPGPLPFLGLGTFAWYVNNFKKKKNLNIKK